MFFTVHWRICGCHVEAPRPSEHCKQLLGNEVYVRGSIVERYVHTAKGERGGGRVRSDVFTVGPLGVYSVYVGGMYSMTLQESELLPKTMVPRG